MKKFLNLTFSLLLLFSTSFLFAQVFMMDPRIDLNKLPASKTVVSIASAPNFPNGLACLEYKVNQTKNNMEVNPKNKLGALPVDPSKAIFFIQDFNGDNQRFDPVIVTYVAGNPGTFMGPDGEEIKLSKISIRSLVLGELLVKKSETGNKSVTNENTIANLKNKDRKNPTIGTVDVPTNKPKLQIECLSGGDEIVYAANFSVDKKRFDRRLVTLIQSRSENAGAGEVLTNAKLLGEKLIELSEQCKGQNQPEFCNQPNDGTRILAKAEALLEEIRKIPGFENLQLSLDLVQGLDNIK